MLISTSEEGVFKEWDAWEKWKYLFEEKEEVFKPVVSRFEIMDLD